VSASDALGGLTQDSLSLSRLQHRRTRCSRQTGTRNSHHLQPLGCNLADSDAQIACDDLTNSEIVVPIVVDGEAVGVLDLDCERAHAWDEDDRRGLESIVDLLVNVARWHTPS
jgi:GAF domain-containing protein